MKELKMTFSDDEYALLQRVANRRRSSIRSFLLRCAYDLDFKQEKREYEKHGKGNTTKRRKRKWVLHGKQMKNIRGFLIES